MLVSNSSEQNKEQQLVKLNKTILSQFLFRGEKFYCLILYFSIAFFISPLPRLSAWAQPEN